MADTRDLFDRSRLILRPLEQRIHNLALKDILPLERQAEIHPNLNIVAEHILCAREEGAATILMMGAHVLRSGVQRYLIDMMERGFLTCLASNGAALIHDFEFSLVGATTESVRRYIRDGRFGLWAEIGQINSIVHSAAKEKLGLGQAVGRAIEQGEFPHRDISLLAAAYRLKIPFTIHVGIGYDIVYEHPNCDGAAYGATSYRDFLMFTRILESLQGGVVMNFGSAVMAPEVYLKALSMARNLAVQEDRTISRFTTLVCDLQNLPDLHRGEPSPGNPEYYFRPWKTMLVRTVESEGQSFYVQGDHRKTIPQLWSALVARMA